MEERVLFIGIFFLVMAGIFARFCYIDKFPPGISHDELDLVLSAKTYFLYGTDASGVSFPASIIVTKLESATTGLPSLLLSPVLAAFGPSLAITRVLYVLINLLTGIFMAKLLFRLTKDTKISLLAFAFFLLNPWSFFYTRVALAAPFSLLFLIVGFNLLFSAKARRIVYAYFIFLLSSLSYIGALPVVPLLVLLAVLLVKGVVGDKKIIRLRLFLSFLLILSLGAFLFISKRIPNSTLNRRAGEVSFLNFEKYASEVNDKRRQSIDYPGKNLLINKATVFLKQSLDKYFGAFSADFLFLSGDSRAAYNFARHGMFYYLDAAFIVLGLLGIYIYGKKALPLVTSLVILGPLGSTVSTIDRSYVFRSFPLLFAFIILLSFGFFFIYKKLPGRIKKGVFVLVFTLYLISFARFLAFFFFEYSVKEAENHYLSERVLVNYLAREKKKTFVAVKNPSQVFRQYVFFANQLRLLKKEGYSGQSFKVGNLIIENKCPSEGIDYEVFVLEPSLDCEREGRPVLIQNQKDAGTVYMVYESSICEMGYLDPWRRDHRVSDYEMEKMGNKEFCNRWLATFP